MQHFKTGIAGVVAGAVNGMLGAGGGMLLIPLLQLRGQFEEKELFPSSVAIILPICVVSLVTTGLQTTLPWKEALPYLMGAVAGGLLAGILGHRIPTIWLHRILGIFILWGGVRYLWM